MLSPPAQSFISFHSFHIFNQSIHPSLIPFLFLPFLASFLFSLPAHTYFCLFLSSSNPTFSLLPTLLSLPFVLLVLLNPVFYPFNSLSVLSSSSCPYLSHSFGTLSLVVFVFPSLRLSSTCCSLVSAVFWCVLFLLSVSVPWGFCCFLGV